MKREPFASAAGVKWRRHRALGLLAAGLATDAWKVAGGNRLFGQTIATRLAHSDTVLAWHLDDVAARGSMLATLDPQQVWRLVRSVPPWRRSLALRSSSAVDAVDAWLFFETQAEAKTLRGEGWRFWVSARVGEMRLPTRPPFLVGYFAETAAEHAATQLDEDEDLHPAFSISALSRATPHCEIQIVCHRDLESAVEQASRASAAIGGSSCDLCIVLLKEGLPERARTRAFARLRDTLRASGLVVGKGDVNQALELTRTLIQELTEGKPLWRQRFKTQAGPAMLLCDERLATHRVTTWTPGPAEEEAPAEAKTAHTRAKTARPKNATAQATGAGTPTSAPAGGKRFPFLPSGAELKRRARSDSKSGPASGGARPIRGGPRRSQGGDAPIEPRRGRTPDDSFGKTAGAPPASLPGSGWVASAPSVVADGGDRQVDEKPKKPPARKRRPKPQKVGAAAATGRGSVEPAPPAAPEPESPVRAAQQSSPAPKAPEASIPDTTIFLDGADDEPTLSATSGGRTAVLNISDDSVQGLVTAFDTAMSEIARDPAAYEGVRAPGTPDVLRVLAQKGASLRGALEQSGGLPPRVTHVQLKSTSPGASFPIEYLYVLEPPDDAAEICDKAEEGLRVERSQLVDAWCPGCTPMAWTAEEQSRTLCPLAFWGARCAIERPGYAPGPEDFEGDGKTAPEPRRPSENVLHPLRCAVVGATDRVEPTDAGAMTETVGASVGALTEAEDWSDWEYFIKREPTPSMLALLAHQKRDARTKTPQLEIGYGSKLNLDALRLTHVRPDKDAPPPLALVLGAETGLADMDFASFAMSFQSMGAIVVSSVAPIHARHAARVASGLLGAIARSPQPVPLAELMTDVRRRLLADGTPAMLSLVALADADWNVDGAT